MKTFMDYITIHLQLVQRTCTGSCNTHNNLTDRVCVPKKTEDLNLNVLDMIAGINE